MSARNPWSPGDRYSNHFGPLKITFLLMWSLISLIFILVSVFFAMGWIRLVLYGDLTTQAYAGQFWYDILHLGDPSSLQRMKKLLSEIRP